MEKASKLWRLLKVFTLIEAKPGIGAAELAERCETSLRTIYRDVYLLKLAGIPLYYQQGYRIDTGFFLPPVQFDLTEMLSLVMGAEMLSRQKGTLFQRGVESAMEKIYAAIPHGILESVNRESAHFTPAWEPTVDYAGRLHLLNTLEKGVEEVRSVAISYHTLSPDEVTRRTVDPYGFLFRSNAWYLVGYCHLRGEIKLFKVDRILEAELQEDRFQLPEDFSIREYMGDAWQVLRGEPCEVEVRFSPQVSPYVKEASGISANAAGTATMGAPYSPSG